MKVEIPDNVVEDYITALDKFHDVSISALKPKERYAVSNNLMRKRQVLENHLYNQIIKLKKDDEENYCTKKYEVWVTLEKWDGDDKIEDVQTTKIFESISEKNAELIWSLCEGVSLTAKKSIDGLFYN